jgi:protein-L-isoaspartate(D-aspartate) O-methyltransferase
VGFPHLRLGVVGIACGWLAIGCNTAPQAQPPASDADRLAAARRRMVDEQIAARGVRDPRVLEAIATVPRHLFVSADLRDRAYDDHPLPIGHDQTISQPYIVALMTETARPQPTDRAFEVGTGSGYQAAVLSRLVAQVYTIELIEPLARQATERLARLGHRNVTVRVGDGYRGWPEQAPFDVIVVTAAPDEVPQPLLDQLKPGGRLVIPVGPAGALQELLFIEKDAKGTLSRRSIAPVQFVPMRRKPT